MNHAEESGAEPRLSVVIPVYNDPRGIRETLESVAEQTYPTGEYEVLAVDNGSTDGTREVIRAFASFYGNVHLLVEDDVQGSYAARNEGIRQARGELVSFVDADMTVEDDWAESIVASYDEHGWDYMGYPIESYIKGRETLGAVYDRLLGGFPVERYMREKGFTVTASLVVTRELLEAVGPFDERYVSQGDGEFGKRVREAGFDQRFEPGITAYHPTRADLRAWLKKQVRIGRGAAQHRRFHPELSDDDSPFTIRRLLPPRPGQFYRRLAEATDPTPRRAMALYGVDYLSKLARTAGAIAERIDRRR
ncbi:glycosyltransferase [Halalkalicoccus tibetensis]|uniref:Glycosyltransferase n=1 Tax=Halalkalicoccus tibetensis TaxID=175632 RepID=A0ABD5V2H0_9EURY